MADLMKRITGSNAFLVLMSFAVSMIIGLFILASLGVEPVEALRVMIKGAFGSRMAIGDTLAFMTPRLLAALAALIAIRCGFYNLGAEGQLQLGAIGAVLPATLLPPELGVLLMPISIVSGALFGAFWGLIPVLLKLWRGANEIIVTLMMNFIGIYLVKYLVQGPLQPHGSDFNMSAKIADGAILPVLVNGTRLHAGVLLALVVAVALWALLYHSTFGIRLRVAGLSPKTARLQGMPLSRLIVSSMLISGGVAGMAGAVEVLGVQYRLIDGFSSSLGFDGLAIALLGSLEPLGAVIVAIYFGAISSGTVALQSTLSIPAALALIMTGLPIIFLACIHGYRFLKGRPLWSSTL
ncbi:ABC transporter permease [Rhizobium sp. CFBP 8762]|uniref:ABC transporter permease n=1 Tax=Rhizobium sp. CFBP 8762 TaxID=2775279 RepID=UPI00177EB2F2|nr:ABC transporter permease [Rhizobium sp. CFBP 8762]MBD8555072.1 ABC transporter permease [Rhizobium sp. CFBP 8762]